MTHIGTRRETVFNDEDGAYDHMGGESCGEGKIWRWKATGWVCETK